MDEEFDISGEEQEFYEHHRFTVDPGQSLLRIDKFLATKIVNVSRSKIQHAADAGAILVDNKAVKSNYKIKPGNIISVVLPYPPRDVEVYPENIPLNIVFEDDDLIIVDKAAGMVVHPAYANFTGTMVNALLYHLKQKNPDNDELRPFLAHRIDKDTSGILVVAKNEFTQARLSKYFFDHSIDRKYTALVWGDFDHDSGTIRGHIGRNIRNRKMMDVYPGGEQGRHAVTHYTVLKRFRYVSLIECRLETGRTHQIRAHMKFAGHPIFGDTVYGGNQIVKGTGFTKYRQFINNLFELLPRQALHARFLGFVHPRSGKYISFESELPCDFSTVLEKWKNYTEQTTRDD